MWFRKPKPDPAEVSRGLREQIFSLSSGEVGISPGPGHTRVWSVVMETAYPEAVVSLVAIADGTTSLYFSTGGGVIGAGQHAPVRAASEAFIAAADANVAAFASATHHRPPEGGRVRFYARTFDGLLTTEASEEDLGRNRHHLSPLFHLGHAVIAAIREAGPAP